MRVDLANPENYLHNSTLFFIWLNPLGSAIAVWAQGYQGFEFAVETAAGYGHDLGHDADFTDITPADLAEAREDLGPDATDEEVYDYATRDLYYTESGYLGPDWHAQEIDHGTPEYEEVLRATIAAGPSERIETSFGAGHELRTWTRGHAWVPEVVARLQSECGPLLTPVDEYPRWLVEGPDIHAHTRPMWTVNLGCWPEIVDDVAANVRAIARDLEAVGAAVDLQVTAGDPEPVDLLLPTDRRDARLEWEYELPVLWSAQLMVEWPTGSRRGVYEGGFLIRAIDATYEIDD